MDASGATRQGPYRSDRFMNRMTETVHRAKAAIVEVSALYVQAHRLVGRHIEQVDADARFEEVVRDARRLLQDAYIEASSRIALASGFEVVDLQLGRDLLTDHDRPDANVGRAVDLTLVHGCLDQEDYS